MAAQKIDLEKIVGKNNVLTDEATLIKYAKDQSFVPMRKPDMVVFADTVRQVQQIVRLANKTLTPLIPYSSGKNLHGATVPDQGGIIVNMSHMKNVVEIDEDNWFAMVEPGVTYQELQDVLIKKGFRMMIPFGAHPDRSVLTSYMERDPVLAAPSFECGNSLIMDTEIVLPNGELFRTGNWATGGRPGSPAGPIRNVLYRLWTGAQGTLGIITKMGLQIDFLPSLRQAFFLPFQDLAHAVEPLKRIQRREIGLECFLLNNFNLAALLTNTWEVPDELPAEPVTSAEFEHFRRELPPWVLVLCLNGVPRHPEEKIAYEEETLRELCGTLNVDLLENLPDVPGSNNTILHEMLCPWSILKKFHYKGCVHDLTFKAPLHTIADAEQTVKELARQQGYAAAEIGMYLLPLERGRAIHCEFDLHSSPSEGAGRAQVRQLWLKASRELMNRGAYFDRPYGPWAEMVFSRGANYTIKLKQIKKELDPNNIMNPGKLCFSC